MTMFFGPARLPLPRQPLNGCSIQGAIAKPLTTKEVSSVPEN
jgi:hypothetical protein